MKANLSVVALPVLILDERKLTPSFGFVFDRKWLDPQESIVSILWKLGKMNALPGHVIAAQLGKTNLDPFEGVAASRAVVDMRQLGRMTGLPLKLVRSALIPDFLAKITSPYFRYCSRCLLRGYHSVVHQLDTVAQCPIHGNWLLVECHCCGLPTPYRLNARLLDAPFRCGNCRAFYGLRAPSFLRRKPLTVQNRVALTRTRLRYFSS